MAILLNLNSICHEKQEKQKQQTTDRP